MWNRPCGSYTFALQGSQIEFACGHIIYNIRQPGSQRESGLGGLLSREAGTEGSRALSLSDSDNSTCTNESPLLAHTLPTGAEMLQLVTWHACYAKGQLEELCRPAEHMLRSCTGPRRTHTSTQTQRKVWKTCGCCTTHHLTSNNLALAAHLA
jgi:hypothetical protein